VGLMIFVPLLLFPELTPSDWTNMIECWTGSLAREGQKGSCHEKAEVVQFRIQASSG
jgi:hypothetical protein